MRANQRPSIYTEPGTPPKGGGMVAFLSGLVLGAFILAVAMVVTIAAKTKGEDA